jgi:hypothetical protein
LKGEEHIRKEEANVHLAMIKCEILRVYYYQTKGFYISIKDQSFADTKDYQAGYVTLVYIESLLEGRCNSVKCAWDAHFGRLAKTGLEGAGSHANRGRNRQRRFVRL